MAVGTVTDPDHPAEVVRFNLRRPGEITKLTNVNGAMLVGKKLGKTEELTWTSSGNTKVQGWMIKPPDFDPSKKYPLILEIHGGPYGNYNAGFNYMWQNFAANDFIVLYANPRGSTGFGHEFSDGIDHNYPGPDYDDLMSGVDAAIAKGFVNTSHMYVSGCSGGGSAFELGDRAHGSVRRGGRPLPRDRLAQHGRHTDVPCSPTASSRSRFGKIRVTGCRTPRLCRWAR